MLTLDAAAAEISSLEQRQRDALEACVIAAMALCAAEGEVRDRTRLVMECYGRYMRAWGEWEPAVPFGVFLESLRTDPVGDLLPEPAGRSPYWSLRLLEGDGSATPALTRLAMEASDHALNVPGLSSDVRHLHSVLRALGKLPAGARLSRITAEAVQHAVFRALQQAGFAAYTEGREVLVTQPVLQRRALSRHVHLTELGAYTVIPPVRQFAGWWAPCPVCNWTMRATPKGRRRAELACEDERHRQRGARFSMVQEDGEWRLKPLGELRQTPELKPVEGWVALSYGLWQWITVPGLLEIEVKALAEEAGAQARLWPYGDSYDVHITKNGRTWRVDVKTWADPQGIAQQLREDPDGCDKLVLVIPEHLRGYIGVLNRVLRRLGARVITDVDLIAEVQTA
ncbi:hypothetical protein [Streptomyces sp. CC208A]|uniref:restriction endonuclease-related protein n=1 Tax=Streptomyces sp. CC208A TaxID=3044573 RepID=UPI0024A94012|nr:hypothetical protein [Streptomyces sp. CC208A]